MDRDHIFTGLTFDDVLLEPRESSIMRDEVKLETKITRKIKLQIPILSSAMDTVSETAMAISLGSLGGMAVIHRNCSIEKQAGMIKQAKKHHVLVAGAVGPADLKRAQTLDSAGADAIVLDTAHAHQTNVIKLAKEIKKSIKAELIVGNIATREAAKALSSFADALKVGIGPGSICTTRIVAGVGVPQLTAIMEVVSIAKKKHIPVIADGGIKYSGDIVKALGAGATAVMLGSILAGTTEAPGKLIKYKGRTYKSYRGMGSLGAMNSNMSSDRYFQKNAKTHIPEGVEGMLELKGNVEDIITQITGGIRSGMGYIGAGNILEISKQARFIRITNAGLKESHPHNIMISKKAPNY